MAGEISAVIGSRRPVDDFHPVISGVDHIKREWQRIKHRKQEGVLPSDLLPLARAFLGFFAHGFVGEEKPQRQDQAKKENTVQQAGDAGRQMRKKGQNPHDAEFSQENHANESVEKLDFKWFAE
ncbi:MAG: hypothetical protein WCZ86_11955 [Desulfurivibrionaceae bacterium]